MTYRKTKIVGSLGPSSCDDIIVKELILAGMNIARLNFSHGDHETHGASIDRVRRISDMLEIPVAILLDLKGPEIRTGMVEHDGKITINEGDSVIVTIDDCLCKAVEDLNPARISISWKQAPKKLQKGHRILIADGLLELEVMLVSGDEIKCHANNTACIGSKKNVNLIGIHANLPIMAEQDKKDIAFGVKMGVDFIAASFVSFPHEITEIKKYLLSLGSGIKIIAKIENGEGVDNIKKIAELADGIMIARGDLGVQLPTEKIPLIQKYIISICRKIGKPVITATQMLESMVVNPRPTRAELTDVANAIFDGTDAVMLSGETANGAYPVEAVKTMVKIALTVEQSNEFCSRMKNLHSECFADAHNSRENMAVIMAKAGVEMAMAINAKVILTPTFHGNTARLLSVFRPAEPVFAITPDERAIRDMLLYWGVYPFYGPPAEETEEMIRNSMKIVIDTGIAGISDKVMLVAGFPLKSPNMVNALRALILGTVLASANSGGSANPKIKRAQGRVIHALTPQDARNIIKKSDGEILVCDVLTDEYTPILRMVNGVICEGVLEISEAKLRMINPELVWLTHIFNASKKLESGLTVTIDAEQLLVYEGVI